MLHHPYHYSIHQKLVRFLIAESARVMEGTSHAGDFFFYHDALSLMTAKGTRKWMSKKVFMKKWLVPQNVVNGGTRYEG